jgi:hypothetical protein
MPDFLRAIGDEFKSRLGQKDTAPVNRYEGFQGNGADVLRDRRGTSKAEIPDVDEKGFAGSDPLAIYKPTGAKTVSASRAIVPVTLHFIAHSAAPHTTTRPACLATFSPDRCIA